MGHFSRALLAILQLLPGFTSTVPTGIDEYTRIIPPGFPFVMKDFKGGQKMSTDIDVDWFFREINFFKKTSGAMKG
ncbi:MAG: hypothetical protein K2W95_23965 [Candidatus Obscuribacterales bacterium]|nr:hypothetical protein [Candidatus Obscuribacterales bacterium]